MKHYFPTVLILVAATCGAAAAVDWNTAQEEKNRELALNWMREVVMYRHVELAPKYMAADYKEHNPNIAPGLAGFAKYYGAQPPLTITPNYKASLVLAAARGDLVILVFDTVEPDPANPSFNYT